MALALPSGLIELFLEFENRDVRYLLVGGHAVAAHGRPRATKDVDLWIGADRANVRRVAAALAGFGAPRSIVDALRSARPDEIVWMGRPPLRIDFLQTLPAVDFDEAWPRRDIVQIGHVRVSVISKADLVTNKTAVGRPQDRRDVVSLTKSVTASRIKNISNRSPRPAASKRRR